MTGWLQVERGTEPLVIAFPHTGVDLADVKDSFRTPWLARRDTDWWVHCLYDFAGALGATTVRTEISRSVIDVNRDPARHYIRRRIAIRYRGARSGGGSAS